VLLASTCHVEGDILHEAFAVETGAFFEGNCRHADNPLAEDLRGARSTAVSPAPATVPVAAPQVSASTRTSDSTQRPSAATFAPITSASN
jgi:cytoskeletal protein CcmA (bactofilin family)